MDDIAGLPEYGDRRNRCATCGFLAMRAPGTNRIEEADATDRTGAVDWPRERPDCAVNATNLYREIAGTRNKGEMYALRADERNEQVRAVLEKERDGTHWFPWRPHFDATWHLERRDMLRLEQSRREHDLRLKQMELDAQQAAKKIQEDSLEIAKALKDTAEATGRFTTRWTRYAVALALFSAMFVVMTYLFPDLGPAIGRWIDQALGYPFGRGPNT